MNIYFDFDGTLIDSRERLYQLFQKLIKDSNLTFEQYWDLKRNKITHEQILKNEFSYSSADIENFEQKWMNQIELPHWLELDKPFNGMTAHLKELNKTHKLYLITARQSESGVLNQISKYGWIELFSKILVAQKKEKKYDLLKNEAPLSDEDWIVGDTAYDIEIGKKLGIRTAAVLSGFQNKQKLLASKPDMIAEDATRLFLEKSK